MTTGQDTTWVARDARHRRRSARREAQIRRRRFVALAVIAVVVTIGALLLVNAARAAGAGAGVVLLRTADRLEGSLSVDPAFDDDHASISNSSRTGVVRYSDGEGTASSFLVGKALVSEADVSLTDVSLLDGLVTARSVAAVATASASNGSVGADSDGSYVSGLEVDGKPVDDSVGSIEVPGVGTLTVLDRSIDLSGSQPGGTVTALRLTVEHDTGSLPAGSVVVVGAATAIADPAIAEQLLKQAHTDVLPTPEPVPSSTAKPSASKTGSTSGKGHAVTAGKKSGKHRRSHQRRDANGPAVATLPAGSVNDSTMPAPAPPRKELLARFPGAVFPVKGSVDYSDTFGAYRADLKGHRHQGTDIFAAMGTPIVAVLGGTIDYSTEGIGGNNAHLTTPAGDYFYYAHMVRFAKGLRSGDTVRKGQVIGYVGETGDAAGTSPHLHFEIHPNGGPAVDSFPYLEAWRAAAAGVPTAAADSSSTADDGTGAGATDLTAGLTNAMILARRGTIAGLDVGTLTVVTVTHTIVHHGDLPQPDALEAFLFLASLGGVTAIRRLRRPELPELLGTNEMVVRQTIRIAERPLTNS